MGVVDAKKSKPPSQSNVVSSYHHTGYTTRGTLLAFSSWMSREYLFGGSSSNSGERILSG